jgi:hypothetical protein
LELIFSISKKSGEIGLLVIFYRKKAKSPILPLFRKSEVRSKKKKQEALGCY